MAMMDLYRKARKIAGLKPYEMAKRLGIRNKEGKVEVRKYLSRERSGKLISLSALVELYSVLRDKLSVSDWWTLIEREAERENKKKK
jgi:transcriptional regulator with XRE-family HTH domain